MADPGVQPAGGLRLHSARGRWVIAATVLGAGIVMIDGTVVNVALPAIGRTFHSGLQTLQWTVTAYTLTLAAFILVGGSIGDHYGRRRSFVVGVLWFAAASLVCGIAPNATVLILARALQGVGAALLTPEKTANRRSGSWMTVLSCRRMRWNRSPFRSCSSSADVQEPSMTRSRIPWKNRTQGSVVLCQYA